MTFSAKFQLSSTTNTEVIDAQKTESSSNVTEARSFEMDVEGSFF